MKEMAGKGDGVPAVVAGVVRVEPSSDLWLDPDAVSEAAMLDDVSDIAIAVRLGQLKAQRQRILRFRKVLAVLVQCAALGFLYLVSRSVPKATGAVLWLGFVSFSITAGMIAWFVFRGSKAMSQKSHSTRVNWIDDLIVEGHALLVTESPGKSVG